MQAGKLTICSRRVTCSLAEWPQEKKYCFIREEFVDSRKMV